MWGCVHESGAQCLDYITLIHENAEIELNNNHMSL
jgi:hypothetical protein